MDGKIYVTGGSKGLGKEICGVLQRNYLFSEVISLSRDNGYDLRKNLDDFVKDDFEVYVNNAQSGFAQTELLYKLFEANKHRECHIINIGSVSGDGDRKTVNPYAVEKAALEKATTQLQLVPSECRVSLLKPGRMHTEMVGHIDAPKLHPYTVAYLINTIVDQPSDVLIKSITVDVKE